MTRVLVVNHNPDVADIEADELRKTGFEVEQCHGPTWAGACPVMRGERCWQVETADVLLYDVWELPDGRRDLIDDLRRLHPDKPIVAGSPPTDGPRRRTPTSALVGSIEEALNAQLRLRPVRQPTTSMPRW